MLSYDKAKRAADYLIGVLPGIPDTALVLGSGLHRLSDELTGAVAVKYEDIPFLPMATNTAHKGVLYYGSLAGSKVLVFSGRWHCYEGYSMAEAVFFIKVLSLLSVNKLIVTNAAGGINESFSVGDIMMITDHIKLTGDSPLSGLHEPQFGTRFFDMSTAYDRSLQKTAVSAAKEVKLPLHQGVYIYAAGPQYETPAEVRAFRTMGADAVGMSTVPEVIMARSCGIRVLGFSLITNPASGISSVPLSDEEVHLEGEKASLRFGNFIKALLSKM